MKKELKNAGLLFFTQSEYKDRDYNLIDKDRPLWIPKVLYYCWLSEEAILANLQRYVDSGSGNLFCF